ncbi:MAG: PQQ-binding-like beta-propeller repeat protein [Planctomycetota bacterium]
MISQVPSMFRLNRPHALKASMYTAAMTLVAVLLLLANTTKLTAQTESGTTTQNDGKKLIAAAQADDLEKVKLAIESGTDVNSKNRYGATALFFACDRGNQDMVKYLLAKGADPNVRDTFYNATPVTWAQQKSRKEILNMLFAAGAEGGFNFLLGAAVGGDVDTVKSMIETKGIPQAWLVKLRTIVEQRSGDTDQQILELLNKAELPDSVPVKVSAEQLKSLAGKYASSRFGVEVTEADGDLKIKIANGFPVKMIPIDTNEFFFSRNIAKFEIGDDKKVSSVNVSFGSNSVRLTPVSADSKPSETPAAQANNAPASDDANDGDAKDADPEQAFVSKDLDVSSPNWPGFRGVGSRGIADGQNVPLQWQVDDKENQNVRWKTPVAGLGMSCPAVWGDKVFVTTAVADGKDQNVKIGLYGDVSSVDDERVYEFQVVCLSKTSGSVLWKKTANRAKPQVKRHAKSSHANPTVATNGKAVVAFFGSEGLYCYDPNGKLTWKRDLGFLDSGWFYDAGYQWGFGSSPVIYKDRVIVQCDIQGQSFIAAFNLDNGDEIWRTKRDEIPSWSSPTIHEFNDVTMVITNGTNAARGYDIKDGREMWSLKGHSEIVVPTPSVAHGLIFVSSGYSPIQPIYAIRPTAQGDISLSDGDSTNDSIPWSVKRGGPYMPTPIVYGDYLYCCANNGIFSCYEAKTGKQMYRKRMKAKGGTLSFTASPIAADGHIYCTAEDGRVLVVKAGPKFSLVETNVLGESVLATPAVSEGLMIFRGQNHVIAVGKE